jgi:hypothetical protein
MNQYLDEMTKRTKLHHTQYKYKYIYYSCYFEDTDCDTKKDQVIKQKGKR